MIWRYIPIVNRLVSLLEKHEAKIVALERRVEHTTSHSTPFNVAKRHLTDNDLNRYVKEWLPRFGQLKFNMDKKMLAYIAHRICLVENTCIGRVAGNIDTILLRVLTARSVCSDTLEILEIGTMFGSSIAAIYESCLGLFSNIHMTVIDPLNGFYEKRLEPLTGATVGRDVFVYNMERMSIAESNYTLIQKLSTDDEAIRQAAQRSYDVILIDGDHSYNGIKSDFLNYHSLAKHGGYIVFDDYQPEYPGVVNLIDKEVIGLPNLRLVVADARSAVFEVIAL